MVTRLDPTRPEGKKPDPTQLVKFSTRPIPNLDLIHTITRQDSILQLHGYNNENRTRKKFFKS